MKDYSDNKKYQAILEKGKDLFWKHGFRRVSIEEICRESKTSKMTFYKFFPNKLDLAKTILDEVFDESLMNIRKLSDEHESPALTFKKILQLKSEGTRGISEEFIKDLYVNPEAGLKAFLEEKTKITFAEMVRVYEKGQEDGWVRKDLNIPFFMLYIQKSISMFTDEEMLKFFDSSQKLIMEITNLFIYGITPHE
jgi:AcrR family transcriptional regulator